MDIAFAQPTAEPADWKRGLTVPLRYIIGARANLFILLVLFVLLFALLMVGSCIMIITRRTMSDQSYIEMGKMIAHGSAVLGVLAILLRSAKNAEGIEETKVVVTEMAEKANGGLTRAVETAADKAVAAEREQMTNNPEHVQKLADVLCPMLLKQLTAELRKPPEPPA